MDKTKCPTCNGSVERVPTTIGIGYYCRSEDRFIGEYFDGPTQAELNKRLDMETWMIKLILILPALIIASYCLYGIWMVLSNL
jgi:hypothetical protein